MCVVGLALGARSRILAGRAAKETSSLLPAPWGSSPTAGLGRLSGHRLGGRLEIIIAAIEILGGKASDVVRTRIYVTDIAQWREAGEVHSEYFESIRPATTMVQISKLIVPEALVEIEADAIVHRDGG